MADQKFEVGALVKLKSDGPTMTVMSYGSDNGTYRCCWFIDLKEPSRGTFEEAALEAVERSRHGPA